MYKITTEPAVLVDVWASEASPNDINKIPLSATGNSASLKQGFPPITRIAIEDGGMPPRQQDFNGALRDLYEIAFWQQSGGYFTWTGQKDYKEGFIAYFGGKYHQAKMDSGPNYGGAKQPDPDSATDEWGPFGGGDGIPLLAVVTMATTVAPYGFFDISKDNGLLDRAAFPQAWALIEASGSVVDESAWQARYAEFGYCSSFSSGDGSTSFRLPVYGGAYPRFTSDSLPIDAEMKNAFQGHGHFGDELVWQQNATLVSGIDAVPTTNNQVIKDVGDAGLADMGFGTPRVGDETRPDTIMTTPFMKIYGAVTEAGEANIAELITATANKLDNNAGNLTSDGKVLIADLSTPSEDFEELVFISGGTYTAPSAGAYYLSGSNSNGNGDCTLSTGAADSDSATKYVTAYFNARVTGVYLEVKAGTVVYVGASSGSNFKLRFFPKGE